MDRFSKASWRLANIVMDARRIGGFNTRRIVADSGKDYIGRRALYFLGLESVFPMLTQVLASYVEETGIALRERLARTSKLPSAMVRAVIAASAMQAMCHRDTLHHCRDASFQNLGRRRRTVDPGATSTQRAAFGDAPRRSLTTTGTGQVDNTLAQSAGARFVM